MVECERALQERMRTKHDHTDPVAPPSADKVFDHPLDRFESRDPLAIRHEIQGLHRAGCIDGEHYVDPFAQHFGALVAELRPRQCADQQQQRKRTECSRHVAHARGGRTGQLAQQSDRGIFHASRPTSDAEEKQRDESERKHHRPWVLEAERTHGVSPPWITSAPPAGANMVLSIKVLVLSVISAISSRVG